MANFEIVFGFVGSPEKMEAVVVEDGKTVDEIVKEKNFKAHAVEGCDCDYDNYITVTVYNNEFIETMNFEDLIAAKLNINTRSKTDYIYDGDLLKFVDLGILHQEDRHKAKSAKKALKYIASRLSELFYEIDRKDAAELKVYAAKFDIPLNISLFKEFQKTFKEEFPNWDSSDGRCPW